MQNQNGKFKIDIADPSPSRHLRFEGCYRGKGTAESCVLTSPYWCAVVCQGATQRTMCRGLKTLPVAKKGKKGKTSVHSVSCWGFDFLFYFVSVWPAEQSSSSTWIQSEHALGAIRCQVRSSMGPRGMDKMVVGPDGD